MERTTLIRVFMADGVQLADPNPTASVTDAVRILAASGRPDLATAEIRGPEAKAGRSVYTLHRAVGTKGAASRVEVMQRRLAAVDKAAAAAGQTLTENHAVGKAFMGLLTPGGSLKEGAQQLTLPASCLPCLG